MSERWKPEVGEQYWIVAFNETVQSVWRADNADFTRWRMGNCFKTKEKAVTALEKFTALLLSLHETATECNQLPKLTADVFNRPDCPEWAKYAAVDSTDNAYYYDDKPVRKSAYWEHDYKRPEAAKVQRKLIGQFDNTDWKNSLIERPATLPDWCKVGEWVYLSNKEYDKIESIDGFGINLASGAFINKKYIHEEAVSARLRPYNADEMKALVGKVIEHDELTYLVIMYNGSDNDILVGNGDRLTGTTLKNFFTLDGKPCGKIEHLENGEWVE